MLSRFATAAQARIDGGYYDLKQIPDFCPPRGPPSLVAALARPGPSPVIAEIKPASPSAGTLRADVDAPSLARALVAAGARGVSALAVHEGFGGSLTNVIAASQAGAPVLFKDFVVDESQLKAARRCGASATLLILEMTGDAKTARLIERARQLGLETLLEVYDEEGYQRAAKMGADLLGVNNRDLRIEGLPVEPTRAARVLRTCGVLGPTLALSGVESRAELQAQLQAGAQGALIGSALMKARDPAAKLRELIG